MFLKIHKIFKSTKNGVSVASNKAQGQVSDQH